MKSWIHEEILKTWTDAQKRLWESLCSAVPFQPPAGIEAWRETYLKNLASWEAAVKRTLEKEASWVEEWVQRIAREKGTPEVMAAWVQQMDEVLRRWIQTQNQWWDDYFALLRRGGFIQPHHADEKPLTAVEFVAAAPEATPAVAEAITVIADASPAMVETAPTVAEVVAELAATTEPPVAEEPPSVATVMEPSVTAGQPTSTPEPIIAAQTEIASEPPPVVASMADAAHVAEPVAKQTDDLKLINGIGPALEKKLNANGVFSFRDLATLSQADIERIETVIKFAGRIHREDWLGQAKMQHFHKYQEQL